jgi:squalene synthase HpnC
MANPKPTTPAADLDIRLPAVASERPRENFPVLSLALARRLRPGFASLYSFCRVSDDIADDPQRSPEQRLDALRLWRDELVACVEGSPRLPLFVKLHETIGRHRLPAEPFHRLLDAFEEDQRRFTYETWSQIEAYAACSANPVGELVLRIGGHGPEDRDWPTLLAWSDDTCSALQFINFWQDVRRDLLELGRVYIPLGEAGMTEHDLRRMAGSGRTPEAARRVRGIVEPLVDRTETLMRGALELPNRVDPALARPIRLFQQAGLQVVSRIRAIDCATLWRRPRVPRLALVLLTLSSLVQPVKATA